MDLKKAKAEPIRVYGNTKAEIRELYDIECLFLYLKYESDKQALLRWKKESLKKNR